MTNAAPLPTEIQDQYTALNNGAGLVSLVGRSQIELLGDDRTTFLHNLCTNDVKGLQLGTGCEAFVTTVRGKILGHVFIFCCAESLVIDTVAGQAKALLTHLDRYLIREKVQLEDRTESWREVLLSGLKASAIVSELIGCEMPTEPLTHCDVTLAGVSVSLRRLDWGTVPAWLLSTSGDQLDVVSDALLAAGVVGCGSEALEMVRLEAGMPCYGQDISEENLPQEVGRNEKTISFTKGCYLGQETVARIDALGHVNRTLVGVKFAGDVPAVGCELTQGETVVGKVTSAVYSPRLRAPLALAYVRRGSEQVGMELFSTDGSCEVVQLPLTL